MLIKLKLLALLHIKLDTIFEKNHINTIHLDDFWPDFHKRADFINRILCYGLLNIIFILII